MCSSAFCLLGIKHHHYVQRLPSSYFVLELLKMDLVTLKEFQGVMSDAHTPWRQDDEINQASLPSHVFVLNFPAAMASSAS